MRMKNMATSIRWFGCLSAILFAAAVWALLQPVKTGGGLVSGVVGNDKSSWCSEEFPMPLRPLAIYGGARHKPQKPGRV